MARGLAAIEVDKVHSEYSLQHEARRPGPCNMYMRPIGILLCKGVTWTPLPAKAFRYAGRTATSVLPSPVRISAISPLCRIMPPISCTSNGRKPRTRLEPSRTTCTQSSTQSECFWCNTAELAARYNRVQHDHFTNNSGQSSTCSAMLLTNSG